MKIDCKPTDAGSNTFANALKQIALTPPVFVEPTPKPQSNNSSTQKFYLSYTLLLILFSILF